MNEAEKSWFKFHFGEKFVDSKKFNPDSYYDKVFENCYVLMADFCSFTKFVNATSDIKVLSPLLTSFYTSLREEIHRSNGMIDKIMGDAVIGIWGIHNCTTDQVKSIFECATRIIEIGKTISQKWQMKIDVLIEPTGIRIGISKGRILVLRRDAVLPGLSLVGDPINLVQRLESKALPNKILCSNSVAHDARQNTSFKLKPYELPDGTCYIDAHNYGRIKVWIYDSSQSSG